MGQLAVDKPISALEQLRLERLISLLPKNVTSVLEIGARHGVMTQRLAEIYDQVTALDLKKPLFQIDGVRTVEGDVQRLEFPDNSFDCVICTEVLEHVPDFGAGAKELVRVSNNYILLGVPYRQDTRVGRTTCVHCGNISPPFGHLNSFDEGKIRSLFSGAEISAIEYVSENRERTNIVSSWLQDLGGNPYGTYDQEEACIHCGGKLESPKQLPAIRRLAAALGSRLYRLQYALNRPRPTWILVLFKKRQLT
jgi:cyclopropane fatty-acyl-phospholipid synthase-like methyltransferase